MQRIRIGYIRQTVIIGMFFAGLMMTAYIAGISAAAIAQIDELPPEIQMDIIISSAKKDIMEERWQDALQDLERALKLGVKLPGEFHFYYGKALLKTGDYEKSLSSLTNYLTLAGRDGEYYEEAVTLVVEAADRRTDVTSRPQESEHRHTVAAGKIDEDMVYIKGGCFDMGDIFGDGNRDEKPVHTVCVGDFYLGKTEVTQKQWFDIMGKNPAKFKCDDCPVERVSWNDVQEFIRVLNKATGMNYRLPTEAEWEYAARNGGGKEQWAGADNETELDAYAWYGANSSAVGTHAVAGKKPNGLGLYDMLGNVWEWCSDRYDKDYYRNSPAKDPAGSTNGSTRVLRGGGWKSKPDQVRTTDRNDFTPGSRKFANIGFRLARTP